MAHQQAESAKRQKKEDGTYLHDEHGASSEDELDQVVKKYPSWTKDVINSSRKKILGINTK